MNWDEDDSDDDLREVVREYLPQTVVWTTDWTTGALMDQIERDIFNVDPPFQRRSAWTNKKASLYIESLLLGCPVPPITLAELPMGASSPYQYIVIDGKQRLGSLKRFAVDRNFRLEGLETLHGLNKAGYDDILNRSEFSRFSNLPIRTIVMRNWQKDEVLQFVFNRLNTQVTPLSTHELRRSLLGGPFTDYLDERSASSSGVQRILGIKEPDYRLRDAELLLRAISFSCFFQRYKGNLKAFLDTTTRSFNKSWNKQTESRLEAVTHQIDEAIRATFDIFGDDAFQRFEDDEFTGRFNRSIFDLMILAFRSEAVRTRGRSNAEAVVSTLISLMEDPVFARWTQATTKSKEAVEGRVDMWAAALGDCLNLTNLSEVMKSPAPAAGSN